MTNSRNPGTLPDEHPTTVGRGRTGLAIALFAAIVVLIGVDLAEDSSTGAASGHLGIEAIVMVLAAAGIVALWRGLRQAQARVARLDADLERARLEAARYREEAADALRGLGHAIDAQFDRWALTPAEREVGLLMLKGLSHREIATVRTTSEATVRQQALSIYRKSDLRNRSELSAFFLEDLLLPR
ncbi:MAG: LuxR C-terminal-related transcriptional regulator [Vicinamibacterales bacterium]